MYTPAKLHHGKDSSYGLGWGVATERGHRLISHTGPHSTGFKSVIARFVDDKVTVIVLTNQRAADQMTIAKGVAGFCLPSLSVNAPIR